MTPSPSDSPPTPPTPTPPSAMPVVAIVGRPNVGKSSLLNALLGRRVSIVQDEPGVTRDRISQPLEIEGKFVELVDTGGYGFDDPDKLTDHIRHQIELAMARADLCVFVVDAQQGVQPGDKIIARLLREADIPTFIAATKADNQKLQDNAVEFAELGFGTPLGISSTTGRNLVDLKDAIAARVNIAAAPSEVPEPDMHLAIVGKRNAGKSTLVNQIALLYGQEPDRVIVSEVPGTTRDAVDVRFDKEGKSLVVIDTAGVRKKRHMVTKDLEFYSFHRAQKSVRRADVVVLLVDSTAAISEPDKQLARYIHELFKPVLVVVNKWDLALQEARDAAASGSDIPHRDDELMEKYRTYVRAELRFLDHVPIEFTTASTGKNVRAVLDLAQHLHNEAGIRVSTAKLNAAVEQAFEARNPTNPLGKRARIYYVTQTGVRPPEIVLFVNKAEFFTESYQRYMVNRLRELLPYKHVPIRLLVKPKSGGARPGAALGEKAEGDGTVEPIEPTKARLIRRPTARGAGMSPKSIAQRRAVARKKRAADVRKTKKGKK